MFPLKGRKQSCGLNVNGAGKYKPTWEVLYKLWFCTAIQCKIDFNSAMQNKPNLSDNQQPPPENATDLKLGISKNKPEINGVRDKQAQFCL